MPPNQFSIKNISEYFKSDDKLSNNAKKELSLLKKNFPKKTPIGQENDLALKTLDEMLKKDEMAIAQALLYTKEFSGIRGNAKIPDKYHIEYEKIKKNYPGFAELANLNEKIDEFKLLYSKENYTVQEYRAAVDGIPGVLKLDWFTQRRLWTVQNALPEKDAAHNWNWFDSNWYGSYGLPYPFSEGDNVGIDITNEDCSPDDGWELYIRRILTTDGPSNPSTITPKVSENHKYFALYNIRSGVLRMFDFFEIGDIPPVDKLITRAFVSCGAETSPYTAHGLFNHTGDTSLTFDDDKKLNTNKVISYSSPTYRGWLVTDYPLAYDPLFYNHETPESNPYYLNIEMYTENTQQIEFKGNLGVKVPITANKPTMFGRLTEILGSILNIGGTEKSVSAAGVKISSLGNSIIQAGGSGGGMLVSLGTKLAGSAGPWVAAIIAGTQLIRGLMSLGAKSGGVKFSLYEGTLTLEGQIKDSGFRSSASLLLHDIRYLNWFDKYFFTIGNPYDLPYLFKKYPGIRLGTFNLQSPPIVNTFYCDRKTHPMSHILPYSEYVQIDDVSNLIVLNPSAHLNIEQLEVQAVFKKWKENWENCHGDGIVLGDHILVEADPTDDKYLNLFPDSFEDSATTQRHPFILSGSYSVGVFHDPELLIRIHCIIGHANGGENIEVVQTYIPIENHNHIQVEDAEFYTWPQIPKSFTINGKFSDLRVVKFDTFHDSQSVEIQPDGWRRLLINLNAGTDGKAVFLEILPGDNNPISELTVQHDEHKGHTSPPPGFTQIPVDLNAGAGGEYIYVSYKRGGDPLTGISVVLGEHSDTGVPTGYTKIDVDLNKKAKGKFIYLCYKN